MGISSYSLISILLKLHRCFGHGLNICMWFGYNPQIIFYHFFHKLNSVIFQAFLAHLSRRLIGELIVYPFSGVRRCRCRRSQFSNIFSSKTAWLIKAKFNVEPPWEGGTKVCINGPGHMTKMAAMPIYGKNLKKSSLKPVDRFPQNLVCSIGDFSRS